MLRASYKTLRWTVILWITVSTVLNYMDRQTLSILAPFLRDQFHMSAQQYSNIVSAFLLSYTVMYAGGGVFVDAVGERLGMAACIAWWSIATMLHSVATGPWSLGILRFLLGMGEPGNYPAALRATTTWFPKSQRGLPVAVYSSGSALGAILAPPLIAWITFRLGWRFAFLLPGICGLVWVLVWLALYRKPAEYGFSVVTGTANAGTRRAWWSLLRDRNVLGLFFARMIADPVWYFYLFWIPEYLKRERGFGLAEIGLYAWIPFVAADLGGLFAGFCSDRLIQHGMQAARARRRVLYGAAAFAPVGILTSRAQSSGTAIALIAIAGFICFVWFINTATLVSDVFPENVVGSVQGLIGSAGSAGGVLFNLLTGFMVDRGGYRAVFVLVGSMHLVAALILWRLMRDVPPANAVRVNSSAFSPVRF
jgi:ACS family hexuronate transporter-like MFS transporter